MKNLNQFTKFISTQVLLAVIGINCYAQNYEIDPSFNVGTGFGTDWLDQATRIEKQSDNKILVAGTFDSFNGIPAHKIVRLNSDGSIDTTFTTGTGFDSNSFSNVFDIKVQTDGKIIACGYFSEYDNVMVNGIVRLNPNGTHDTTFNSSGTGFGPVETRASKLILHDDGKIAVIGLFNEYNGNISKGIIRLNNDGSIDTSFNTNLGFSNDSYVSDIDFHNGQYIVSGWLYTYGGDSILNIVLLNYDGSIDTNFSSGLNTNDNQIFMSQFTDEGKIFISGEYLEYGGQSLNSLIRLNLDGSVDSTFNSQWMSYQYTSQVFISDNGKLWLEGEYSYLGINSGIFRINQDGSADSSFNSDSYFDDHYIDDVEFSDDGKILFCGTISTFNGSPIHGIVRLQNTLSIDSNPNKDEKITVYPNPATSSVNLSSKNISKSEIQLFDASGRRINCTYMVLNDNNLILNTELLSNGIYTLNVIDETTQNVKIIIQK